MNIIKSLKNGLGLVFSHIKIVPIIYVINLSLAGLLAIPMYLSLHESIGSQGVRDELMQDFNYDWWTSFSLHAKGIEQTLRPSLSGGFGPIFDNLELLLTGKFISFGTWILIFGICYLFLSAFLNGGTIGIFADEKRKFSASRFFSNAGFYYHHFFALALTVLLAFFLVYKLLGSVLFNSIDGLTSQWMSQRAVWFANLVGYFILLLVVLFINMIFDYAKIIVVVEKKNSSWLCIWMAVKFVLRNIASTSGLYLLLGGVGIGLTLLFALLDSLINPHQVILLIVAILFQQVFIFAKIWLRLNFYGAQLNFYVQGQSEVRHLRKV
jgi:hypothetical protein